MINTPIALLAGATGAVGGRLLERLLARDDGTQVVTVGRSAAPRSHARLAHIRAGLDEFGVALRDLPCTEAFCCLGTTIRQAGSRAAFRAVDVDGVAAFAAAARASGAGYFGLVSAAGAATGSPSAYLRAKGDAERAVEALAFPSVVILQPGLLRGARVEFRVGESLAGIAAPLVDRLLLGPLARYRSVAMGDVAAALERSARLRPPGVTRLDPAAIAQLVHDS
jgi:uncharacterized protein YbjT (DUF2867 family)